MHPLLTRSLLPIKLGRSLSCLVAIWGGSSFAATAVSNLGDANSTGLTYGGADSFTTGDMPAILNSISILGTSQPEAPDPLCSGVLWTDAGTMPGTELESFPGAYFPAGNTLITFNSVGTYLQPHTTYWFSMSISTTDDPYWVATTDTSEISNDGWTINNALGVLEEPPFIWTANPDGAIGLMQIDVTFVPEPGAFGIGALIAVSTILKRKCQH